MSYDSHPNAYFDAGDTVILERSPYVPKAEVLQIEEDGEKLFYRLEWTNGNINRKPVAKIDGKANTR